MEAAVRVDEFSIGYSRDEDRLFLVAKGSGREVILMITRRLARGLIVGIGDILQRTSTIVQKAEEHHRNDVIAFEREMALSAVEKAVGRSDIAVPISDDALRLASINITTHPRSFDLELIVKDGTIIATASVGRPHLHKLLDMLETNARAAEWDLDQPVERPFMTPRMAVN